MTGLASWRALSDRGPDLLPCLDFPGDLPRIAAVLTGRYSQLIRAVAARLSLRELLLRDHRVHQLITDLLKGEHPW